MVLRCQQRDPAGGEVREEVRERSGRTLHELIHRLQLAVAIRHSGDGGGLRLEVLGTEQSKPAAGDLLQRAVDLTVKLSGVQSMVELVDAAAQLVQVAAEVLLEVALHRQEVLPPQLDCFLHPEAL